MAFMRRCIIAVDLFGPTPKVLSTPRRQAPEKLDVPAEVRPTKITEERFSGNADEVSRFRLLRRRVSSFFFARAASIFSRFIWSFIFCSFHRAALSGFRAARKLANESKYAEIRFLFVRM
jgi:hypothetical protein